MNVAQKAGDCLNIVRQIVHKFSESTEVLPTELRIDLPRPCWDDTGGLEASGIAGVVIGKRTRWLRISAVSGSYESGFEQRIGWRREHA